MAAKVKEKRKGRFNVASVSKSVAEKLGIELPEENGDRVFSPNEIGEALNVTGEAVKQWIYHQRLAAVKLANGYWQVKKSDLEAFLKRRHESPKRRVLLACKDAVVADKIREAGLEVILSSSKADAVLKGSASIPTLFVIDSTDASYDAWKLVKKIRETKSLKKCSIMLIGSPLNDSQIDDGVKLRIRSVVAKTDGPEFLAELKQCLE